MIQLLNLKFNNEKALLYSKIMSEKNEVANVDLNLDELNMNVITTIREVAMNLGMSNRINRNKISVCKPWHDAECRAKKKNVMHLLQLSRDEKFSEPFKDKYYKGKNIYLKMLKEKKKIYESTLIEMVNNSRNSTHFWKAINKSRPREYYHSVIKLDAWHKYLVNSFPILPSNTEIKLAQLTQKVPELDEDIRFEEIVCSLARSGERKAPGPDDISYGFF